MINTSNPAAIIPATPPQDLVRPDPVRQVLTMIENDRMGGSVPKWAPASNAKDGIAQNLSDASAGRSDFEATLALQDETSDDTAPLSSKPFGFGDLIDMINPLHHIPVIGHFYREMTGDEIRPIGQVVGGTVFGGPLGLMAGVADVISVAETGKDVTGNVFAAVVPDDNPSVFSSDAPVQVAQLETQDLSPEETLGAAVRGEDSAQDDLPASLLSFTGNTDSAIRTQRALDSVESFDDYKKLKIETRTIDKMPDLPAREPITELTLASLQEQDLVRARTIQEARLTEDISDPEPAKRKSAYRGFTLNA